MAKAKIIKTAVWRFFYLSNCFDLYNCWALLKSMVFSVLPAPFIGHDAFVIIKASRCGNCSVFAFLAAKSKSF